MQSLMVRAARPGDVQGIATLVNEYAAEGIMLTRTPEEIALALHDYVVAVDERGRVLGSGALREYAPSLAEVSAIAVAREAHGRGVGRVIVEEVERLALRRGIQEVFALTLAPQFFESLGYAVVDRSSYPEKVRRDCSGCAKRFGCVEICMQRMLVAEEIGRAA